MGYFEWANARIQKMTWLDIGCIKLGAAGFALAVARLWPGLLSLEWYWYALIAALVSIRPLATTFSRR